MSFVLDPPSLIRAAQTAVAAADYLAAERLLGEAASVQEATLGSLHPDLASTLNNLALVYEQTNKIAEAEQCYRRAHAIAVASLLPGHPFVATSLKNLVDFCEARDIPLWRPPAARSDEQNEPTAAAARWPVPAPSGDRGTAVNVNNQPADGQPTRRRVIPGRRVAVATLAAAAVLVISVVVRWPEASPASGSPAPDPAAPAPAIARTAAPVVPVESRRDPATIASAPTDRDDAGKGQTVEEREDRQADHTGDAFAPVTVLNAQLCSALEKRGSPDWQCTSASGDLRPGRYSFYTRLGTNADTTVEHRWYRDERVHQVVRLHIAANAGGGYRTVSSTTISPERAGHWKVEVRAADGAVLQEEQFVVR